MRATLLLCALVSFALPTCGDDAEKPNPAMLVPVPSASEFVPPVSDQQRPPIRTVPIVDIPTSDAEQIAAMTAACTPDGACNLGITSKLLVEAASPATQKKMEAICTASRKASMLKIKAVTAKLAAEASAITKAGYHDDADCDLKAAAELQRVQALGGDLDKLADRPLNGRNLRPAYDAMLICASCKPEALKACDTMNDRVGDSKLDTQMDQTPYCLGPKLDPRKKK